MTCPESAVDSSSNPFLRSNMLQLQHWPTPETMPAPPNIGTLHIWMLEPNAISHDLSHLLCADERVRRESMVSETDRLQFTATRGCVRFILASYLGLPPQSLQFDYSAKGKPQLVGTPPFHFNLSHSGSRALLAVSRDAPLGIDLEREQSRDNLRRIARKLFEPEWTQRIEAMNDQQFMRAFFTRWTQHEARVKAIGEGVFSNSGRLPAIPCVNFNPLDGWYAAIAMDGELPDAENWCAFRVAPELLAGIG